MLENHLQTTIQILEKKLLKTSEPINKVDLLHDLSWEYRYSNLNQAKLYLDKALEISEKLHYQFGIARAKLHKGLFAYMQSIGDDYLVNVQDALHYFIENHNYTEQVKAFNILAGIFDNYGDYEKAIQVCRKGIEVATENTILSGMADCYTTLGQVYSRVGDFELSIQQLEEGLRLRLNLNEKLAICSSLNLIARIYLLQKSFEKSEEYYNKSLVYRTKINDVNGIPWTYLGLATLFEQKEDYSQALELYNKGIELNKKSNEKRYYLVCLIGIGKIQIKTNNKVLGIQTLEQAFEIAVEIKAKPLICDIHKELASAYESTDDFKKTIFHYKQYITLREEIVNSESSNRLKKQQIAFSVEKAEKEAEIFQLRNVELKEAYDMLEEKTENITSSISYAKKIQDALAPSSLFIKEYLYNSFIFYKPKDVVSGDFYWVEKKGNKILFAAVDCTGHGVPGAFVSIIGNNGLSRCINEFGLTQPSLILDKLKKIVEQTFEKSVEQVNDGMDIALCSLDLETNVLEYAGANNPLLYISKGELFEIKADKQPIGRYVKSAPFTNHRLQLEKGDLVYVFSDGYVDQFGGDRDKKFKTSQFKELLFSIKNKPIHLQKDIILQKHLEWKGETEQTDDICVVGVKV